MMIIGLALAAALAFLAGSIPTGLWVGYLARGIDIRQHGSGNTGATNIFRTLGAVRGIFVFLCDAFKGWFMVTVGFQLLSSALSRLDPAVLISGSQSHDMLRALIAVSVVAGHAWSVFLKLDGGKGVATGAGVLLGMDPLIAVLGLAVFVIAVSVSRYISLGSLLGTFAACALAFILERDNTLSLSATAIFLIVFIRHRENIKRLCSGTERKFSFRKNPSVVVDQK